MLNKRSWFEVRGTNGQRITVCDKYKTCVLSAQKLKQEHPDDNFEVIIVTVSEKSIFTTE